MTYTIPNSSFCFIHQVSNFRLSSPFILRLLVHWSSVFLITLEWFGSTHHLFRTPLYTGSRPSFFRSWITRGCRSRGRNRTNASRDEESRKHEPVHYSDKDRWFYTCPQLYIVKVRIPSEKGEDWKSSPQVQSISHVQCPSTDLVPQGYIYRQWDLLTDLDVVWRNCSLWKNTYRTKYLLYT